MKLHHRTQRGGEITVTGPPIPLGETAVFSVGEDGCFEVPTESSGELLRILGPEVTLAKGKRKGDDA